jgi:hypothetical protein
MTKKPSKPTPEQIAFRVQLTRMDEYLKRIVSLYDDSSLTAKQKQELIAEELVSMQETGKSALRLVFKL